MERGLALVLFVGMNEDPLLRVGRRGEYLAILEAFMAQFRRFFVPVGVECREGAGDDNTVT